MNPSDIIDKSQDDLFSPENINKKISIIWSGGCDSTLVLDDVLWELHNRKDPRTVTAYSFKHWQISDDKMAKEETARAAYKHYALSKGYPLGYCHTIELPKLSYTVPGGCPQPALWISNIMPIIQNDSLLYAGYIKGDDFFTYDIFKNWSLVFEGLSYLYGKKIVPMFPRKYWTKTSIIKKLKERNILNLTWHCETPISTTGAECGYCDPCQKHNESLKWIDFEENRYTNTDEVKLTDLSIKKMEAPYDSGKQNVGMDTAALP
jgi:7-cyano-7-deazaguanine synthase in queuosine biosynthesis